MNSLRMNLLIAFVILPMIFTAVSLVSHSIMGVLGIEPVSAVAPLLSREMQQTERSTIPARTSAQPSIHFDQFTDAFPECDPNWEVVPSPNAGTNQSTLVSVSVLSSNDVWSVGSYRIGMTSQTLTEHWNGSAWNVVASPNIGILSNQLTGVTAISSNDVWAVGYARNVETGVSQTLTQHWDGSSWSIVSSPSPGTTSQLSGIAAVSATDIWAVGSYNPNAANASENLIERWNGSTWSVVASPNTGTNYNILASIAAVSSTDVWAVGSSTSNSQPSQTLTMHWDGSTWNIVSSPNSGSDNNQLTGVAAISNNDVWAVGYACCGPTTTLTEHWDGSAWSIVSSPNAGTSNSYLRGVVAVSSSDVWAVGEYGDLDLTETLVEHWNGTAWSIVPSVNPGTLHTELKSVDAVSSGDVWAVGYSFSGSGNNTLVERYNPCAGTPSPTSVSTSTSTATPVLTSTPTRTVTPPAPTQTPGGPTATPEPTHCVIEFTDVAPGSTFYDYVRCMACRGIINGYTTGCETGAPCFRPNNNVTRGQLSKIVANAASYTEPAGAQQYEDVLPGSTFYEYIWRLANRGYVSGYACGGPGEPCGPGNLPYFRPNGNATRGQISKIVSNAAGYTEPVGSQIFEDVVPGSTFYDFVQRLASRSVMSGYACGGPGEPCNPPDNRPYFRPSNLATRGQTSKIVANSFFPNCQTPAR